LNSDVNIKKSKKKKKKSEIEPAMISFEVKQISHGYNQQKKSMGNDMTIDFLLNDLNYNDNYGMGVKKNSSRYDMHSEMGTQQTNINISQRGGMTNYGAPMNDHAKREEIDMAELNQLLGLNDNNFDEKFNEMIGGPKPGNIR